MALLKWSSKKVEHPRYNLIFFTPLDWNYTENFFLFSSLSKPPPPPPPPPPDDDVVVVLVNAKPNADTDKKDAQGSGQDGRAESGKKLRLTPIFSSMSFRSFTKLPQTWKLQLNFVQKYMHARSLDIFRVHSL